MGEDNKTEKATFAAGCFWSAEAAFRKVEGVQDTEVGFMDGAEVVNVGLPPGGMERSAIFTHSAEQAASAQAAKEGRGQTTKVNTQVAPSANFQRADEKHQRYYEKRGIG
jgi:peptide-methionine (S)-S-oxide reductase